MVVPVQRAMMASQVANAESTTIKQYPTKIGPHGILMMFRKYRFERPGFRGLLDINSAASALSTAELTGAVLLPLPFNLSDATSIEINKYNFDNTILGETAAVSANEIINGGAASDALSSAYDASLTRGVKKFLAAMTQRVTPNLADAVSMGAGVAINPKASVIFNGVNLKHYNFMWSFTPNNEMDSENLKEIIKTIKRNSLPSYAIEDGVGSTFLFDYPSTVDVFLLGLNTDHFMKFKTCMVNSIDVNYSPNNISIVKGGKPSSIQMSISLLEMDIHTAEDYAEV